jgi:hypothetical protein
LGVCDDLFGEDVTGLGVGDLLSPMKSWSKIELSPANRSPTATGPGAASTFRSSVIQDGRDDGSAITDHTSSGEPGTSEA